MQIMSSPFTDIISSKKKKIFAAPMADVTNPAFRALCAMHGADLTFTEMINADGLLNGDRYAEDRGFSADGKPYGVQISGSTAEGISKAACLLEDMFHPAVIDINMGCPSPRIVRSGCGASLLTKEGLPAQIVRETVDVLRTPVSVKMRILKCEDDTIRLAESIQDAGAAAVTVHGRTRDMMYAGKSDTAVIRRVRETLSIPVIANGDVRDEASASRVFDETGCDTVMIGRAAIGNPFIFERISFFLTTGKIHPFISERLHASDTGPSETRQRVADFIKYCDLLDKNDLFGCVNIRAHAQWFTSGLADSGNIRLMINDLHKNVKIDINDRPALTEERKQLAAEIIAILEEHYGAP